MRNNQEQHAADEYSKRYKCRHHHNAEPERGKEDKNVVLAKNLGLLSTNLQYKMIHHKKKKPNKQGPVAGKLPKRAPSTATTGLMNKAKRKQHCEQRLQQQE